MSESAPESSGGGNVLTRKIGPLAMWVWMIIGLGIAVAYYLYQKNKAGSSSANDQTGSGTDTAGAGGVDSSLVPQFVNQTYVNGTPPAAPTTAASTTPAPTPTGKVAIPNVVGMKAGEADQYLDALGLKGVTSGIGAGQTIKHQDPKAGSVIAKGASIYLSATNNPTTPKGAMNK